MSLPTPLLLPSSTLGPLLALALATGAVRTTTQDGLQPNLRDRRTAIVDVIEAARPAVVSIDASIRPHGWALFNQSVSGTGVVIYEDGTIVTNYHVVGQDGVSAKEILVRFDEEDDENVYEGRVISAVPSEDLALIKIDGLRPFPTIEMSDEEPLLGETVVTIGNAVGRTHTVSTGIISGLHRDLQVPEHALHFKSLIQTDAAINPGNSGGPLLDINGRLVGINTAITRGAENIGFAIPVARVRWVLANQLLSLEQARSYVGYDIDEATFTVTEVAPAGPADVAGLEAGDRIVSFDGREIADGEAYNRLLLALEPYSALSVEVERGDRTLQLSMESWSQFDGIIHRKLGVTVRRVFMGRSGQPYLQFMAVDPKGPAGRIGLQAGDLIAAVRPRDYERTFRIHSARDLAVLLYRLEPDSAMDIEVWRDENGNGLYERNDRTSELFAGSLMLR